MQDILKDGLFIFYIYMVPVAIFFLTAFGVGYYSTGFILNRETDVKVRLLASLGVGCILLSLIAFVFIVLFHISGLPLQVSGYLIILSSIYVVAKGIRSGHFTNVISLRVFISVLALFFLMLLRLAFLKHILLPPYSDSPVHYQIVFNFLHPEAEQISKLSLQTIFNNYYHFGFHSLAAWLTSVTGFEPTKMISLVGQLSLVIAPVSIVCLTYTLTMDINGALFAGLLTSIGWIMPAFAVNWGKYPALFAIALLPVAASSPLFLMDNRFKKPHSLAIGLILLAGITFVHTRILICLFFVFVSYFIVSKLQLEKEFSLFKSVRFTLLFLLFLWPLSQVFVDFYKNVPILILLLLIPFAFHSYPTVATGVMIFLSGLSATMLIPNLFPVGGPTLLDRQFLAMILYIPLATMGGLGFGGLVKKLEPKPILKYSAGLVCVICVFVNLTPKVFYPDHCCDYYNENNNLAFQWIQQNSSSHTLYFISTFNDGGRAYGTDAGVWISPLTNNATNKLPFNIKWNSVDEFNAVCPQGKSKAYVYMGGRATSFADNQLSQLSWVTPVFQTGEVVIYEISNCMEKE